MILSRPKQTIDLKSHATSALLHHVPKVINQENFDALENLFTLEELFYALKKLPNEKTPGLNGFNKEFLICYW